MTIRSIGRIAKQPVALFNGGLERYEQALLADQAGPPLDLDSLAPNADREPQW